MSGDDGEIAGWMRRIRNVSGAAREFVERVRAEFDGDPETGSWERWRPVLGAAGDVVRDLAALGREIWLADESVEVGATLERINRRVVELMAAFPDIAELFGDLDRFDRWLDERVERPGVDSAVRTYLGWAERVIDGVVRRLVDRAFADEAEGPAPERIEGFLERLDDLLREVLEEWVVDSTLSPGPSRDERPHSEDSTRRSGGSRREH